LNLSLFLYRNLTKYIPVTGSSSSTAYSMKGRHPLYMLWNRVLPVRSRTSKITSSPVSIPASSFKLKKKVPPLGLGAMENRGVYSPAEALFISSLSPSSTWSTDRE
jgi:hypothetical protein